MRGGARALGREVAALAVLLQVDHLQLKTRNLLELHLNPALFQVKLPKVLFQLHTSCFRNNGGFQKYLKQRQNQT